MDKKSILLSTDYVQYFKSLVDFHKNLIDELKIIKEENSNQVFLKSRTDELELKIKQIENLIIAETKTNYSKNG